MRAGKLAAGEEAVLKAIRSGEAKLLVVASDISEGSLKKYKDKCNTYHVPLMFAGSRSELGGSIGKAERVAIAVCDAGFARLMQQSNE